MTRWVDGIEVRRDQQPTTLAMSSMKEMASRDIRLGLVIVRYTLEALDEGICG